MAKDGDGEMVTEEMLEADSGDGGRGGEGGKLVGWLFGGRGGGCVWVADPRLIWDWDVRRGGGEMEGRKEKEKKWGNG